MLLIGALNEAQLMKQNGCFMVFCLLIFPQLKEKTTYYKRVIIYPDTNRSQFENKKTKPSKCIPYQSHMSSSRVTVLLRSRSIRHHNCSAHARCFSALASSGTSKNGRFSDKGVTARACIWQRSNYVIREYTFTIQKSPKMMDSRHFPLNHWSWKGVYLVDYYFSGCI